MPAGSIAPSGLSVGSSRYQACIVLRCRSSEARDKWQMPVILTVIETVPDQELLRRIEADPARLTHELFGHVLVEKRAELETLRPALFEQRDQTVDRVPAVDYVFHQ